MKRLAIFALTITMLGLALGQSPPETEDPNAKGKKYSPIDIESFPDPKSPAAKATPATKSAVQKPADGPVAPPGPRVLVVGVRQLPERMSPSKARTDPERWALDLIFEGLLRPNMLEAGMTFTPCLAAAPPRAETGGRAFVLDPAAKWTDVNQSPVLANDVLATLDKLRAAGVGDAFGEAFSDAPRRLRLTFRNPHPDPAALCTFKVLPANRADDDAFARQPVGSGPFVYAGRLPEDKREFAIFKANPQYVQRTGRSNPSTVREVRFLASADPLSDFRRGYVDMVVEESTAGLASAAPAPATNDADRVARLESGLGPDARMVTRPSRRVYYLALNPIKTAFGNDAGRNLRRAIAFGIDREAVLNHVWRLEGQPFHKALFGPFLPDTWPCDPEAAPLDDRTLAQAELRAVKLPNNKFTLVYPNDEPLAGRAAPLLAEQLTGLGVPTEAKGLPPDDFAKTVIAEKNFDIAWRHFDYRDDWFDPAGLFAADAGGMGGTGTTASRLESAIARCAARCEFAALREARRRLHREFREAMPFVPLWTPDIHVILRRKIEPSSGIDRLDPQQPFLEIDQWRVGR